MGVGILRVVLGRAGDLNLLETPLRKVSVASAEVAAEGRVLEAERSSQSADTATVARSSVTDDLNLPVVLVVANSQITVRGNLAVSLCHRGSNLVRVEVATGGGMDQANDRAIGNVADVGSIGVVVGFVAVGVDEPVVVGILVVVASNLLLLRTLGVGLDVRVKESTTIAHVLDGGAGANGNLKWAILANVGTLKIGLEQRAHLGIAWASLVEDSKVESEGEHVDEERHNNETNHTSNDVGAKSGDGHLDVAKLGPEILDRVETNESRDKEADELNTADAADADSGKEKPKEPLRLEAVVALAVEFGPAEDSGDGTAEKHRIEKNESANGGV